jgi:hypothetical protein
MKRRRYYIPNSVGIVYGRSFGAGGRRFISSLIDQAPVVYLQKVSQSNASYLNPVLNSRN